MSAAVLHEDEEGVTYPDSHKPDRQAGLIQTQGTVSIDSEQGNKSILSQGSQSIDSEQDRHSLHSQGSQSLDNQQGDGLLQKQMTVIHQNAPQKSGSNITSNMTANIMEQQNLGQHNIEQGNIQQDSGQTNNEQQIYGQTNIEPQTNIEHDNMRSSKIEHDNPAQQNTEEEENIRNSNLGMTDNRNVEDTSRKSSDLEKKTRTIADGSPVDEPDVTGKEITPTTDPVLTKQENLFSQQIKAGLKVPCDVNMADKHNITPLHQIFIKLDDSKINDDHDIECISMLVKLGANIDAKSNLGFTALHYAVGENRSIPVLQALIDGPADLDVPDDKGCSPLYYAVAPVSGTSASDFKFRDVEIAEFLIKSGAKIDLSVQNGRRTCNSFLLAVFCQRVELVSFMLNNVKYKCNLEATLPWLHTIFNWTNFSNKFWNNYSLHRDNRMHGYNALFVAVCNRDLDMVKVLVEGGVNINAVNNEKITALHLITKEKKIPIIENPWKEDNSKHPIATSDNKEQEPSEEDKQEAAIVHAETDPAENKDKEADRKISPSAQSSVFEEDIVLQSKIPIAEYIIARGADVNILDGRNQDGKTALQYAIINGHHEIAKAILDNGNGVDYNTRAGGVGHTALFYAVEHDKLIAKALIQKPQGLDLNIQDTSGKTVLHHTVLLNDDNLEIIELLLEHYSIKPDIPATNNTSNNDDLNGNNTGNNITGNGKGDGNTSTESPRNMDHQNATSESPSNMGHQNAALTSNNTPPVQLRVEQTLDINRVDSTGKTALHYAVSENSAISRMLIEAGSDVNIADTQGKTVLHHALYGGRQDVCNMLLQKAQGTNIQ